ncbi:MAG: DUF1822 family protein [Cyanobacteria bacterium P01_F01_bin.150]
MTVLLDCSDDIWVEIDDTDQEQLWQQMQAEYPRSASRWQAYINQLCLSGVMPWLLEQEDLQQQTYDTLEMNGIAGTAVRFESDQFILMPSEAIDRSELRVPQEWVDIPNWVGDYYLAVQVNPDEGWVKMWGYTTHQTLKQQGSYDESDRTYSLDGDGLTTNIALLMVTRELCPDEATQVALGSVASLFASLSSTQVNALIEQLSQPGVLVPRLELSFETWGALLANDEWRSRLSQALKVPFSSASELSNKLAGEPSDNTLIPLGQWLDPLLSGEWLERGWQTLDSLIPSNVEWAMAFRSSTSTDAATEISMGKRLAFEVDSHSVPLLLLVRAITEADGRVMLQVQLRPESDSGQTPSQVSSPSSPQAGPPQAMATMPDGIELALLAPTGDVVQSVQGRSLDAFIQLKRFRLPANTAFSLRVQLGNESITEDFTT